jgi:hypothetical protein
VRAEELQEGALMNQGSTEESRIYDYYVYELRDPRNNETFYVGMGRGARVLFHGNDKKSAEHPKEKRISDIKESGHSDCLRVIIGSYETSEEAFAVEATLINWVYGYERLTNINAGRHNWCIRPAAQHQSKHNASVSDYPHMDGIDRPKLIRSIDGAYTLNQMQTIEKNKIEEKLNWINLAIQKRQQDGAEELENITMMGLKSNRYQDQELVLSINETPVHAHLKLQLTGKSVSFNLRPRDSQRSSYAEFARYVRSDISDPYDLTTKRGGVRNYVKAEPKGSKYCNIPYDDIDTILMVLKKAQLRLTQKKE